MQKITELDPNFDIISMDIDFKNAKIYLLDANSEKVFRFDMNGQNKKEEASLATGETLVVPGDLDNVALPRIKVDNGKLYLFTFSNTADKRFKLSRKNLGSGAWTILYDANVPDNEGSSFSYDILPGKAIFYTLFSYNPNSNLPKISTVGRMNLDGTGRKGLYLSATPILQVTVAIPKSTVIITN